ncbi:DUF4974 domain-containing protein [Hymenobacter volaticus]|uniref:DUF4974 domain-containing protein n=1 Tax=Hymenobacter volaticus TaxID=2932254 RepID=A0ABY4GCU7_9BACT|nr:DUF4974 domain-containing protein [Hymenobacter volaticus]UOQ68714.1 DUF4974 domain-containing protein [Hymenobacter volaticus]
MLNRICLVVALFFWLADQPALTQGRPGSVLDRKVTVVFNRAPLESVLRTLRRQYGVRISYSNTALNLQQPVTLNVQNQSLRTVLNTVLADKNIGYELVGDQVVLHPVRKEKPQPTPTPTSSAGKTTSNDSGTSPGRSVRRLLPRLQTLLQQVGKLLPQRPRSGLRLSQPQVKQLRLRQQEQLVPAVAQQLVRRQ